MIEKLRRKFILVLMSVVAVILLSVFVTVLLVTQQNIQRSSIEILRSALDTHPTPATQEPPPVENSGPNPRREKPPRMRSPVLLAEVGTDNNVFIITNQLYFVEETDTDPIVQLAAESTEETGVLQEYRLRYLKHESETGTKIAFVDISMEREIIQNLLINSLFVGGVALLAFFIISLLLARWVVRPVEIAWEQQRQFVADASHELKTPLTVILSNADMLCGEETALGEKNFRRIEHIQAEGNRMKQLVEDMLLLAQSDSMEQKPVLEEVNFSYLVTNSVLIFEPIIFDEKKKLDYEVEQDIYILGEKEKLQQLLHILLDNARKYCPKGGQIFVDLKKSGQNHLLLTIFNEGEPIPQEELEEIFLRFYRRDKSRSHHGGFGLGLSIADRIVKGHGGKIWSENSMPSGNNFFVSLPLHPSK